MRFDEFAELCSCASRARLRAAVLVWAVLAALPALGQPIVFVGDKDLPPYEFIENGVAKGANVDLAMAIGRVLKRPVEVRLVEWLAAQAAVLAGDGDALTLLGHTPERERDFDFSQPTVPVSFALFVRADEATSLNDHSLAGRRVGVTRGGLAQTSVETQHPEADLVLVDNLLDGTRRLLRRDIDALAAQEWSTYYLLNELGVDGVTGLQPLERRQSNIAVRKGNREMLAQIDHALVTIKASGEFDRIMDRWSHTRFKVLRESTVTAMAVGAAVATLVLLLLALGVVWQQRQKRKLASEISERAKVERELRESQAQLETASRNKDQFLAMLGHELRSPIAAVAGATQLLRRLGPHPEKVQRANDIVERQVGHLRRLIDDLLDVRRISSGRLNVTRAPIEIQSVVRDALDLNASMIEVRRHRLEIDMPEAPVRVNADAVRLCQIVANLLNNAAKYTPPGGHIRMRVRADEKTLEIAVTDNGIGIDPGQLTKVFDMFHQEEHALALSHGGLGIGLSLTRGLVELHGGTIAAHSAGLGKGSEFIVRLPTGMAAGVTEPPISIELVADEVRPPQL